MHPLSQIQAGGRLVSRLDLQIGLPDSKGRLGRRGARLSAGGRLGTSQCHRIVKPWFSCIWAQLTAVNSGGVCLGLVGRLQRLPSAFVVPAIGRRRAAAGAAGVPDALLAAADDDEGHKSDQRGNNRNANTEANAEADGKCVAAAACIFRSLGRHSSARDTKCTRKRPIRVSRSGGGLKRRLVRVGLRRIDVGRHCHRRPDCRGARLQQHAQPPRCARRLVAVNGDVAGEDRDGPAGGLGPRVCRCVAPLVLEAFRLLQDDGAANGRHHEHCLHLERRHGVVRVAWRGRDISRVGYRRHVNRHVGCRCGRWRDGLAQDPRMVAGIHVL
eukprot:365042-Chlamydomonas_euryale.AAC.40